MTMRLVSRELNLPEVDSLAEQMWTQDQRLRPYTPLTIEGGELVMRVLLTLPPETIAAALKLYQQVTTFARFAKALEAYESNHDRFGLDLVKVRENEWVISILKFALGVLPIKNFDTYRSSSAVNLLGAHIFAFVRTIIRDQSVLVITEDP